MVAEPQQLFQNSRANIQLVSFASDECCQHLIAVAQRMKVAIKITAGEFWLSEQGECPTDTIIVLGDRIPDDDVIVKSLSRSKSTTLLALSRPDAIKWNPKVASYCQDVMTLPCDDLEFAYRVDRLFCHGTHSQEPAHDHALVEKLEELGIVGRSAVFLEAMQDLMEFAACDVPILLQGETGTGKELAARAIHSMSDRAQRRFVSINCGALPDHLVENELFGHERGAFTDAKEAQQGLVTQACGGTLLLDEVDTLSASAQAALLRFLESGEYRAIGGKQIKMANARIIASTNANLHELVAQGKFRRDLLFRLDVCGVTLPPLREREGDIDLLTDHFLARYAEKYRHSKKSIHPGMIDWMRDAQWLGNVRELDNLLHRRILLTKTNQVFMPEPLPGQPTTTGGRVPRIPWRKKTYKEAKNDALEIFERDYLNWLMAESGGNLSQAARRTHLQRSSLRRLLQKHSIDKNIWKSAN